MFAPSSAIEIGSIGQRQMTHLEPVSLSRGISDGPAAIYYYPIGFHIMTYQMCMPVPLCAPQYYFGRDFSLGMIDSNYPGTPFLTQFLADP